MFKQIFDSVRTEISGKKAKDTAAQIARFHRIEVSPHYREAAEWCHNQFRDYSLSTELTQYTADGKTMYWSFLLPEEWSIQSATLKIGGELWAEFCENNMSVIQRSCPVHAEAEIITIETIGEEPFNNVKGKIVYSPLPLEKVWSTVFYHGALGIILSGTRRVMMRAGVDICDALYYYSFKVEEGSGFVITPRKGEILKKMLREKPMKAEMVIESRLYPGHLDVVEAFIPGETEEEVLVVAHLCHPQPSANDNASGCAVLMETARTLQVLISKKRLPPPKRGIRFLLAPEMVGTVTYLASHQEKIPAIIAGINLEMVGRRKTFYKSPLLVERTPDALPSFVNDLAELILEEVNPSAGTLSARYGDTLLSGRSDHLVLSDPTVGIPSPMLFHRPDILYHSSLDTPGTLDPAEMERAGQFTATYLYFIACAGEKEAAWLAGKMCEKAKERIVKKVKEAKGLNRKMKEEYSLFELLDYMEERELLSLRSVKKLANITTDNLEKELKKFVKVQKENIPTKKIQKKKECTWIPRRLYRGPISMRKTLLELPYKEKRDYEKAIDKYKEFKFVGDVALFWADGKRTVTQIDELTRYEMGTSSLEFLMWYFGFLHTHGLILLKK